MQRKAAEDLQKLVTDALVERGVYEGASAMPRRGGWPYVVGLPAGRDVKDERRGTRRRAPGRRRRVLKRRPRLADQAVMQSTQEGQVLSLSSPGRAGRRRRCWRNHPAIIRAFPWPKSMRWGEASPPAGAYAGCGRCTICAPGPENGRTGHRRLRRRRHRRQRVTFGHRFGAGAIRVRRLRSRRSANARRARCRRRGHHPHQSPPRLRPGLDLMRTMAVEVPTGRNGRGADGHVRRRFPRHPPR